MKNYIIAVLLLAISNVFGQQNNEETNNWKGNRPDGHAPISITADHIHAKGEFMVSYKYMYMTMQDLKQGSEDATVGEALANYMATPYNMPMQMHMVGLMFAPTNRLTLNVMGSYLDKNMDHVTKMGSLFTTKASGFADTKVNALYKLHNKNHTQLHAKLGVSLPTGSIEEMDKNPASMGKDVILPYPMQIGSGTFDVEGGLTFLWQSGAISGGNQVNATIRTSENNRGYTLGNRYDINNWFAVKAADVMSFSVRVKGESIDGIKGINPDLNPAMVITADTNNSGGKIIEGGFGINFYVPNGALKNLRLGLEISHPLYQNLDGIQLKNKESFVAGLQYAF